MMRYVVFDVETQNTFDEVEAYDPVKLDISVASVYDSGTDSYTTVLHDELSRLWPLFEHADVIVGYNSNHFDIPLLNKYYPGDLFALKSVDLLEAVRQSLGKRLRLDTIAQATLKAKKSGHGLQAITWWKSGEINKIKQYCEKDVEITKRLFEYAREHGNLKYKDGYRIREIPIDTSGWTPEPGRAMTHSLPF